MVKPIELPFPLVVTDRIERDFFDKHKKVWLGQYKVPFPFSADRGSEETGEVRWVQFPPSVKQ